MGMGCPLPKVPKSNFSCWMTSLNSIEDDRIKIFKDCLTIGFHGGSINIKLNIREIWVYQESDGQLCKADTSLCGLLQEQEICHLLWCWTVPVAHYGSEYHTEKHYKGLLVLKSSYVDEIFDTAYRKQNGLKTTSSQHNIFTSGGQECVVENNVEQYTQFWEGNEKLWNECSA